MKNDKIIYDNHNDSIILIAKLNNILYSDTDNTI